MLSAPKQPAFGAALTRGTLRRGLVCALLFHGGSTFHEYTGVAGDFFYIPANTSLDYGSNKFGKYVELTAVALNERIISGVSGDGKTGWLPDSNVTVALTWQKTDSTNRSNVAFSISYGLDGHPYTCHAAIPYSDGILYWQFGQNGQIISASGLTYGEDYWVFTVGGRGMEAWQNGIMVASGGSNYTRSVNKLHPFVIGGTDAAFFNSDLARINVLCVWDRQLATEEILALSANPYAPWEAPTMFEDTGRLSLVAVGADTTGFPSSRSIFRRQPERWG